MANDLRGAVDNASVVWLAVHIQRLRGQRIVLETQARFDNPDGVRENNSEESWNAKSSLQQNESTFLLETSGSIAWS